MFIGVTATLALWLSVRLEREIIGIQSLLSPVEHRLFGLVGKASTSRAKDPEFDSRLRHWDLSGSSHTSDLKICTPVAALPGVWRYWVSAGTGLSGVSVL